VIWNKFADAQCAAGGNVRTDNEAHMSPVLALYMLLGALGDYNRLLITRAICLLLVSVSPLCLGMFLDVVSNNG